MSTPTITEQTTAVIPSGKYPYLAMGACRACGWSTTGFSDPEGVRRDNDDHAAVCTGTRPASITEGRAWLTADELAAWDAAGQPAPVTREAFAAALDAEKARRKPLTRITSTDDMTPELRTAWEVLDRYGRTGWPLSTQGPHRTMLTLDGFRKVGNLHPSLVTDCNGHNAAADGSTDCPVFVLRFGARFYALSTYPDGQTRTLYAADYEPKPTRARAETIAAALVDGTYTPERHA